MKEQLIIELKLELERLLASDAVTELQKIQLIQEINQLLQQGEL